MTDPPADAGPERQIFLRALRSYSDQCEAPELTAGCPFAVQISPTERGCGEECMDLLARHAEPVDPAIDLGKGLGAFPLKRPRRGPTATTKPFDAFEVAAVEEGLPLLRRSPTSLLLALTRRLGEPPGTDRDARQARVTEIAVLIAELEKRGFDAERLAKHIGVWAVLGGVLVHHLVPKFLAEEEEQSSEGDRVEVELPTLEPSLATGWERLFQDAERAGSRREADLAESALLALPRIHVALDEATLGQVVAWEPPNELPPALAPPPEDGLARWVRDRFTATYLLDWALTSLEHEWQYLHGDRSAPCEPRHMASRRIDRNEVAYEITRRQVGKMTDATFGALRTADSYVMPAIEMCRAGRRSAAAAIFEAMRAVNPRDEQAHNNYGFCVAPDQPDVALKALDEAAHLGMRHNPMNVGNRMYVLAKLGRLASALEAASELWSHLGPEEPAALAFMWRFDTFDNEAVLDNYPDVYAYVLEFAGLLSELAGDGDGAETWRQRAASR